MSKPQRYEILWDEETRLLAERAALAGGHSNIKAYLTHLIREDAPKLLARYEQLKVTSENYDRFMAACNNPPKPPAKLKAAANKLAKDGIWIETKD